MGTLYTTSLKFPFIGWILLLLTTLFPDVATYPCMVQNGSSIFLTIPESFTPGKAFKTLDMIEGDSSAKGNINLRLKEPNAYFGLDGASKSLVLLREIDRETLEAKNPPETVQRMTLICEYLDVDTWRRIDIPIQIVVTDINDNGPVFHGTPYKVTINELTPIGGTVFKNIHADDADSTGNMVIYSVVKGPYSDYVRFDDTLSGNLVLNQALDYEKLKSFNVTIAAKDQGNPPLTATTSIEITVDDGDDHNPEFLQRSYTAVLPRDVQVGYELRVMPEAIHAIDKDKGINAPVRYKVVEGPNWFDIDKTTGIVSVNGTVSSGGLFILTIQAAQVEHPDRNAVTTLRITAERPNLYPPRFQSKEYYQKVPENLQVGANVLTVRADDRDPDSKLVYTLHSTEDHPHFNLTVDGDLIVAHALNYEERKHYSMFARVSDGELTDEVKVTIDVLNLNQNDPEFSQKQEYVFEPKVAPTDGLVLGTFGVRDKDCDNVTVKLLNYGETFKLEGRELSLVYASSVNQTEYRLNVVAEDDGSPPRRVFTTAIVRFPPQALAMTTQTVDEYFVLAIVLGGVAGFLLFVVLCLVCYVGKTKPWARKSPAGTIRTSALDDDTRGLTYKQRHQYHDMPAASSSSSSSESDASSNDIHPAENKPETATVIARISAWDAANPMLAPPLTTLTVITPDLGLSPKGIILSTGNNTRSIGGQRKQKRLKWEDEEQPRKPPSSGFEYGWQSSETLTPVQSDAERPEVTVYF